MMFKNIKNQGITILELLFVIAIIAVVGILGVSYLAKELDSFRVKRTVLQMQQILQGGVAYYVDSQHWPEAGNTYTINSMTNSFSFYLSNLSAMQKNPWMVDSYHWEYPGSDSKKGKFRVFTDVGSNNLAQRVAGLLPMAILTDSTGKSSASGTVIRAEVIAPPANLSSNERVMILGWGRKNGLQKTGDKGSYNDEITLNTDPLPYSFNSCPPGKSFYVVPGISSWNFHLFATYPASSTMHTQLEVLPSMDSASSKQQLSVSSTDPSKLVLPIKLRGAWFQDNKQLFARASIGFYNSDNSSAGIDFSYLMICR